MSVLQPLAYSMMCTETRELALDQASEAILEPLLLVSPNLSCSEFLQMVENSSGLLLERENGVYAFAHLTFQEYLAAKHIQEEKLEWDLEGRVTMPWWHETIRLYTALGDASGVVQACISATEPSVPALTLAVECPDEARPFNPICEMRSID